MLEKLSFVEMYELILNFFTYKASRPSIDEEEQVMTCVLYDAFILKCQIDRRYQTFGAGIVLDTEHSLNKFFGEYISFNNDEKSILKNLKLIDNYCRLRLPDKYLALYDNAYKA